MGFLAVSFGSFPDSEPIFDEFVARGRARQKVEKDIRLFNQSIEKARETNQSSVQSKGRMCRAAGVLGH